MLAHDGQAGFLPPAIRWTNALHTLKSREVHPQQLLVPDKYLREILLALLAVSAVSAASAVVRSLGMRPPMGGHSNALVMAAWLSEKSMQRLLEIVHRRA